MLDRIKRKPRDRGASCRLSNCSTQLPVLTSLLSALLTGFLPALLLPALARLLCLLAGLLVWIILLLLVTHYTLLGVGPADITSEAS
jgi:hypothetical protein